MDPDRTVDIEVAISEATTNVVRHAYAHPGNHYSVTVDLYPAFVRLTVKDQGRGFDRHELQEPLLERMGSRGVWLIERLVDEVSFSTVRGSGCRLEAHFHLSPPLSPPLGRTGSRWSTRLMISCCAPALPVWLRELPV